MAEAAITVVTAYHRIPAKFGPENYTQWLRWLLTALAASETPTVAFTDQPDLVQGIAADVGAVVHVVKAELPGADDPLWARQLSQEPTRCRTPHTPQLFAAWAAKPHWLRTAATLNPFGASYLCWVDAGCFRTPQARPGFPRVPPGLPEESVAMQQLRPLLPEELVVVRGQGGALPKTVRNVPAICGAIFIGTVTAMLTWASAVEEVRATMLALPKDDPRHFVGIDEYVYVAMYATRPGLIHVLQEPGDDRGGVGSCPTVPCPGHTSQQMQKMLCSRK